MVCVVRFQPCIKQNRPCSSLPTLLQPSPSPHQNTGWQESSNIHQCLSQYKILHFKYSKIWFGDRSLFGYCYFLRGLSALVLPLHWSIFLTKGTPTLGINPNVKKGGVIEIQPESCSSTASVGGYSQGNLAFLQWFHLIFSRLRASLQSFKELTIACGRYLQARAGYSSELARVYFIMQVKCGVILELRSWFRGHLCRSHGVRQPNPMAMWGAKHGLFSCSLVSTWPGGSVSNLSTQLLNKQTDPYSESGRLFPLLPCSQAGELKNKEVLWHVTIS